jgi:hypothetical protein
MLVVVLKAWVTEMDPVTPEIGLAGGEPTLLGDEFLRIIRVAKSYLPTNYCRSRAFKLGDNSLI